MSFDVEIGALPTMTVQMRMETKSPRSDQRQIEAFGSPVFDGMKIEKKRKREEERNR
jgi:hypothetical protein